MRQALTEQNEKYLTKPEGFGNWGTGDKLLWLLRQYNWVHGKILKQYSVGTAHINHSLESIRRKGYKVKSKNVRKYKGGASDINLAYNTYSFYHLEADDESLPVEIQIVGERWEQL